MHSPAATGNCAPTNPCQQNEGGNNSENSTEPQPKQVLLGMEALILAQKQSMSEAQRQKAAVIKARQEKRREMKRAIEESRAEYAVYGQCKKDEEAELQKALVLSSKTTINNHMRTEDDDIRLAIEQSLIEEQERSQRQEGMFGNKLNDSLVQSANNDNKNYKETQSLEDLDLLKILELSLKEKEICDLSEEDAIQRAIELSQQSNDSQCVDKQYMQQEITVTDSYWYYIDPQEKVQVRKKE